MCRRRLVCHVYTQCTHPIQQPEQEVRCTSANCKFSPYHDPNCKPPSCTKTCAQYRAYPEQHTRHIDSLCPDCEAAAAATSSGRRRR